jgi:hypothetical protein
VAGLTAGEQSAADGGVVPFARRKRRPNSMMPDPTDPTDRTDPPDPTDPTDRTDPTDPFPVHE